MRWNVHGAEFRVGRKTATDLAGTWAGAIASSNNSTEQVTLLLMQSGV